MIAGDVRFFAEQALEEISGEYKPVMAGEDFVKLFDAYHFRAVWYVSGYAGDGEGRPGETEELEQLISECARSGTEKLILLSTVESQNFASHYGQNGIAVQREYLSSRALKAAQMEDFARFLAEKQQVKLVILWLPYVADMDQEQGFLGNLFAEMYEGTGAVLPGCREDRLDFVAMADLVELLCQITEETEDESGDYFVVSGGACQYQELAEALRAMKPGLSVKYGNEPSAIQWPERSAGLRKAYGFVPMVRVMEGLEAYYRAYVSRREGAEKDGGFLGRLLTRMGKGVFPYVELVLLFLLTEFVSRYTSENVYFRFVDVRLLYIVMMGSIHGMRFGLLAAILECVVLVREFGRIGMGGTLLFFNIENWLPFAAYLLIGSSVGYLKDKKESELTFSRKEYELLRNKYMFLNEVYHGAIENKGAFRRQILGFKDSFGKIFDAVQKLDSYLPGNIFLEGLRVMEDILENHTIAIYSLDSRQRFGRLMVCSNSLLSKLTKSLRLADCQAMYEQASKGEVWRNMQMESGLPMYACGVFRDGSMALLITIQEAGAQQYSLHYTNLFKILCGLVETSFLRALDYEQMQQDSLYYKGTQVVYPNRLAELVRVHEEMRQAGVADYVLVCLGEMDKGKASQMLSGMIRANDVIGAGEDGKIYLILSQISQRYFPVVGKRLEAAGISYELVDTNGDFVIGDEAS